MYVFLIACSNFPQLSTANCFARRLFLLINGTYFELDYGEQLRDDAIVVTINELCFEHNVN